MNHAELRPKSIYSHVLIIARHALIAPYYLCTLCDVSDPHTELKEADNLFA